jgi:hypothetical protein
MAYILFKDVQRSYVSLVKKNYELHIGNVNDTSLWPLTHKMRGVQFAEVPAYYPPNCFFIVCQ